MNPARKRLASAFLFAALVSLAANGVASLGEPPEPLRLLVPAYFPVPGGRADWKALADAHRPGASEIIAVANIGAGHVGKSGARVGGGPLIPSGWNAGAVRSFYAEALPYAAKKGVRVLGYVSTRRGERPLAEAKKDIDEWKLRWQGVAGIFLDEQAVGTPAEPRRAREQLPYYVALRNHVLERFGPFSGRDGEPRVVTNPGDVGSTPDDLELYLGDEKLRTAADVMVIRETASLDDNVPPAWTTRRPAARFAALVHRSADLEAAFRGLRQKRLGAIYVTDAPSAEGESEWSRLPKRWRELVNLVRELNRPSKP